MSESEKYLFGNDIVFIINIAYSNNIVKWNLIVCDISII